MASPIPVVMLLAAGLGTRLGKLGIDNPKALMPLNGKPVIIRLLERLRAAGVTRCVINLHHLGEMIAETVGDGSSYGLDVHYSREPELYGVAGGIANALPLLGNESFIVTNADICSDLDFTKLIAIANTLADVDGHLILGENPLSNPAGDFSCVEGKLARRTPNEVGHSYIGTAIYRPQIFSSIKAGNSAAMAPLWDKAISCGRLTGELHRGWWIDIGTPQQLAEASTKYASQEG